ncbi:hypothetical protein [Roseovarius aestuariivivens]|uniref:hypothetical protein n=1 Tax=Roseovarius aestuariivivens TaxID=1888910 RepID=UPI00107FD635|nr:hypothetical protein [Roseovarius aestuariivivens]
MKTSLHLGFGSAAALCLVLAGCDVPPEGTTVEDVSKFESAVASVGCDLVGESDYLPVELQAGLTREQSTAMAGYMVSTGKAVRLSNGGVRLTTGACA